MDITRANYNSANSQVLATYDAGDGNVRMLLYKPHPVRADAGPAWEPLSREFVIGSYFHATPYPDGITDFEWSWGNYFSDVTDAVGYWNEKVLLRAPVPAS